MYNNCSYVYIKLFPNSLLHSPFTIMSLSIIATTKTETKQKKEEKKKMQKHELCMFSHTVLPQQVKPNNHVVILPQKVHEA